MPNTTCPVCHNYIQVPDIRDTELYHCPYCPPASPFMLLYKCYACMKVSPLIINSGISSCPKCFTILRSEVRAVLAHPGGAPQSNPGDWVYHITTIKIANSIKLRGLQSSYQRTHMRTANPEGAFARNRDAILALPFNDKRNRVTQRLKQGIAYLLSLNVPKEKIEALQGIGQINFRPTGNDTDAENLHIEAQKALMELARNLGINDPPKKINEGEGYFEIWRDSQTEKFAVRLAGFPVNGVTAWANDFVRLYYLMEELKTTQHIYFIKNNKAADGYNAYTKGVSKAMIAILRVKRRNIQGLKDDVSEAMAECTKYEVYPQLIEIMIAPLNPDLFTNPMHRDNDNNWLVITHWG